MKCMVKAHAVSKLEMFTTNWVRDDWNAQMIATWWEKILAAHPGIEWNAKKLGTWYDHWYDMIWHDMTWYGMIWHDMAWYGMIWHDMAWYDMIWHDMTWFGMIGHDMRLWEISESWLLSAHPCHPWRWLQCRILDPPHPPTNLNPISPSYNIKLKLNNKPYIWHL